MLQFFTLALFVHMEFPIKFDTVKSGWPIVYIEGSQVIISPIKKFKFLSLKIDFALKYPFRVFCYSKG